MQRCDELIDRRSHERRLERRDAGREQCLTRSPVAGRVRRREVDAAEAVDVQVDEAGNRDAVPGAREPDGRDPAVLDRDVTAHEGAVDEGRFDADPHALSMQRRSVRPRSTGFMPSG